MDSNNMTPSDQIVDQSKYIEQITSIPINSNISSNLNISTASNTISNTTTIANSDASNTLISNDDITTNHFKESNIDNDDNIIDNDMNNDINYQSIIENDRIISTVIQSELNNGVISTIDNDSIISTAIQHELNHGIIISTAENHINNDINYQSTEENDVNYINFHPAIESAIQHTSSNFISPNNGISPFNYNYTNRDDNNQYNGTQSAQRNMSHIVTNYINHANPTNANITNGHTTNAHITNAHMTNAHMTNAHLNNLNVNYYYPTHIPTQRSSVSTAPNSSQHRNHNYNSNFNNYNNYNFNGGLLDPSNYMLNNYHSSTSGVSNGTYENLHMNGNRTISPHLHTPNNHPNSTSNNHNIMQHQFNHNFNSNSGRYSQTSNNSLMLTSTNSNDVITPEMISVASTSTMSAFKSENVCTQINNILSGSTKDHQAIIMAATKSSANNMFHEHQNGFMHSSANVASVDNDVSEILRVTGFDANTHNRLSQSNYHLTNINNINNINNNNNKSGERFSSYPARHSQVVNSNSHQALTSELDSSTNGGITRSTTMTECQSERNSTTTNPLFNARTNDPYLSSQKTFDFDQNESEHLHQTIRSGAIDLSISSDEDHKNMEFGPIGSNPRKMLYYQQHQSSNQPLLPYNYNTPTNIRRKSQYNQNNKSNNNHNIHKNAMGSMPPPSTNNTNSTTNYKNSANKRHSDSHMPIRTRSLCDSSDINNKNVNITSKRGGGGDDETVVNALSDLSIERDFPDLKSATICMHNTLKTFCSICQNDTPPVPHESQLTRMSAADSTRYTTPTFSNLSSTRHSVCDYRHQSDSPRQSVSQQHRHYYNKNIASSANSNSKVTDSTSSKREMYSRKVFVGGLPQDITETQIALEFKRFGDLVVDWPHKLDSNSGLPPKGYAFLLFEQAESVVNLINRCSTVDSKFFWAVSSQRSESKQVQIRPWTLTDAMWSPRDPIEKPLPRCRRTVFVGGIPRQAQARELFDNMNKCFGGVDLVEIDVDLEYSYPKGAASVTFDNDECYIKALETHFISLKLCGMEKRVEIKPFFSDDQNCEECGIQMNSRSVPSATRDNQNNQPLGQCFCVARACLKYFCENCWAKHQIEEGHMQQQQNKSNGYHRQFQFRRTTSHNNSNYSKSN